MSINTISGSSKKAETVTFDVKLHRNNMQMFLREAESKLGTIFPRECIAFLRTNIKWAPAVYDRSDYMIVGEGINFTAADEAKMKMTFAADELKSKKHITKVLLPAICQHLRNALSPEVENDLVAHRGYSEWAGFGEDQHKCGDDPFILMSMLHDQSRRNRFNDNAILKAIDRKKLCHEQRNINQTHGETVAGFKQRCMDIEAESIMCGLTPLSDIEQVLIFAAGLNKGSKASKHFETLIINAEATPASFPATLNKAWESLMVLETLGPNKTQPSHSAASASANPTRSGNNNNHQDRSKHGSGSSYSAKKPHHVGVNEREQTINVVKTKESSNSFHEYPVHSVMMTTVLPTFEEATGISGYDLMRREDKRMDKDLYSLPSLLSDNESDDETSNDEVSANVYDPQEDELYAVELTWPGARKLPKTIMMVTTEDDHRIVVATSRDDNDSDKLSDNHHATEPDLTQSMTTTNRTS